MSDNSEVTNMSETVKGVVEKINKNGEYYGVLIGEDWFGAGKYRPKFDEGDEVSFDFTMNGKYKNMDYKTVTVLGKGSGGGTQSSSGGGTKAASTTNWDLKDKRITYLASRKDAIEITRLCADKDAFVLPAKKSDRMDVILEFIDELTGTMYEKIYGEPFTGE
jgi:uncharacterized protein YkvS